MTGEDGDDRVGSVAEEAVKLLGALQDWAREGDVAGTATQATSGAANALHDLNEHIATGGDDCRYCPLCQVISAVRETSPEVKEHLATAATSLMHAAAGVLATRVPDDPGGRPASDGRPAPSGRARRDPRRDPVEKIDLSDDDVDVAEWEAED